MKVVLVLLIPCIAAFAPKVPFWQKRSNDRHSTSLHMDNSYLSIVAGSVAGAIGVGVAYPLDALKTKVQTMRNQVVEIPPPSDGTASSYASVSLNTTEGAFAFAADGSIATLPSAMVAEPPAVTVDLRSMNTFQLFAYLIRKDGFGSFFAGVKSMMIGQAFIKAIAFSVNTNAIEYFEHFNLSHNMVLLAASTVSGFVTSFPTAPVERIKVMMQAQKAGTYKSEMDCITTILEQDKLQGLLTRGLGTTLVRDTPSYPIYFVLYEWLMDSDFGHGLPYPVGPLLFGAFAGCMSWWPVYPVDCVKTEIQNTPGGPQKDFIEVTKYLYEQDGIRAFFDGIDAKMLRAGVNHAVVFLLFDMIMNVFGSN